MFSFLALVSEVLAIKFLREIINYSRYTFHIHKKKVKFSGEDFYKYIHSTMCFSFGGEKQNE